MESSIHRAIRSTNARALVLVCAAALHLGCGTSNESQFTPPPIPEGYTGTVVADKLTAVANGMDAITVTATVRDAAGAAVPGIFVQVAATGENNFFAQSGVGTNAQGQITAQLRSTTSGTKLIRATANLGRSTVTFTARATVTFTAPTPTDPAALGFLAQPSNATAGVAIAPVRVAIQNSQGLTLTTATNTVTIALGANPGAATLLGTLTANAVAGVATFSNLSLRRAAGGYTLLATAGALASPASAAFSITPAAAASLAFVDQPVDTEAGVAIEPPVAVEARDAFDNLATAFTGAVTVSIDRGPQGAALAASSMNTVNAVAGVAVFPNLVIEKAGAGYGLAATAGALVAPVSALFDIAPAAIARLVLSGVATSVGAGTTHSLVVAARDAFGNDVTGYRGGVLVTAPTDPLAVLPLSYTFTAADNGVHTFAGVSLRTAGAQTLVATDTSDAEITGNLATTVGAAAAARLTFTVQPPAGTVRAALAPAVRVAVEDQFGNRVTNAVSSINVSLLPVTGVLGGTFNKFAEAGVAVFDPLSVENEGTGYTLTATATGLTSATSTTFNITDNLAPAAPGTFTAAAQSRSAINLSWTAPGDDGLLGSLATGTGRVYRLCQRRASLAETCLNSGQGGVPSILAPGAAQTFAATGLASSSSYTFTLSASDGAGNTSTLATASATTLACAAGYAGDNCDQCATGFHRDGTPANNCVDACTAPNPCTTPPVATCGGGSGNILTTFPNPGTCSLIITTASCNYPPQTTDCAATGKVCFSGACVDAGPVFVLTAPATATAGTQFAVTLEVRNNLGQPLTSYRGTVRFTSSDPNTPLLPADYPFSGAELNATKTFDIALRGASATARTLTVTDTAIPASTATANILVSPGAVTALAFSQQPQNAIVGATLVPSVTVTLRDGANNVATNATGTVSLALGTNPNFATLVGGDPQSLISGVATFSGLSVTNEGAVTLVASHAALTPQASDSFTITDNVKPAAPGTLTAMVVSHQEIQIDWSEPGDDGLDGDLAPASGPKGFYRVCVTRQTPSVGAPFCQDSPNGMVPTPGTPTFPTGMDIFPLAASSGYVFTVQAFDGAGNGSDISSTGVVNTGPCPGIGSAGDTCQECAPGYLQTGDPGVCTHVCTAANPCTVGQPANTCTANARTTYSTTCTETLISPNFYSCSYPSSGPSDCGVQRCFDGACHTDRCNPTNPCVAGAATCDADAITQRTPSSVCTMTGALSHTCTDTTATCPSVCYQGACATASAPVFGDLVITEIMHSPSSFSGAYIEVRNLSAGLINLAGVKVLEGDISPTGFTVPATPPRLVPSRGYFVFGESPNLAENGNTPVNYSWESAPEPFLFLPAGTLVVQNPSSVELDRLVYDISFPSSGPQNGRSIQLSSNVMTTRAGHTRPWYWCNSQNLISLGVDFGSPGADNVDCGVVVNPPVDYCAIQSPDNMGTVAAGSINPVYGRIYDEDVSTISLVGNDFYPWLVAELGYGTTNDPATWTYVPAPHNAGYSGSSPGFMQNDDELQANLVINAPGNYFYGFRVRLDNPADGTAGAYAYCDSAGVVPLPLTNGLWGTVTVVPPPPAIASVNPSTVVRGVSQTVLSGSNLTGTTSVTIGGTAQTFVVNNDGQITIPTVAAGTPTGVQDLVVTTPSGSTTSVGAFNVLSPPAITGVNPTTVVRGVSALTITGSSFTGTTAVTIGTQAQAFTVDSATQITIATVNASTPLGTRAVVVTANGSDSPGFNVAVFSPVRISQVYGGGGSASAGPTYNRDYVEIFNASPTSVNISGWTIEYGSDTGNWGSSASNIFTFPAATNIEGCKYLLVAMVASAGGGSLPVSPDFSSTLVVSATNGKVALFSAVNTNLACGSELAGTLVDKVSFGSGNCPEGTSTAVLSTTKGAVRNVGGMTDTDANATDFTVTTGPVPRNGSSPANVACTGP